MDKNVFIGRMQKVRDQMAKAGIDVFLVTPSSNLFYLTGCTLEGDERLLLLVLPAEGSSSAGAPFILANLLYKEQVKMLPVNDAIYWKDGDDPFSLLKRELEKRKIPVKKAALEPRMSAFFTLPISGALPGTHFVLGSSIMDGLRQFKDTAELDLIRRASRKSDEALAAVIEKGGYWIGKTESDFAENLSAELRLRGVVSFGAAVALGANAALPHYGTGNAFIEKGNCLLVDFWGRFENYYTDCTRTFHFGKPDGEFEKIYAIVLEAHLAAEAAARSGNTLGDVDRAARSVIERYGYGEYFTHRTGHGAGIDIHEGVSVNQGVNVPIAPGMVFSIEPGIYFPGRFGVRIENLVISGEKGPEVLHAYPRELRVIDAG